MSLFENPIHLASFQKIVEFMIAPTPDMDSCEVLFIDTVFFGDEGKPVNIIKTDKEGKLSSTTQANKLVPNDIR